MNDSRTELRRRLMVARDSLPNTEQRRAAAQVEVHLTVMLRPRAPGMVAGYLSYGGELDLRPALRALAERGWLVVLPVIRPGFRLDFAPWRDGDRLVDNRFGIAEPTTEPVDPDSIDVVLVPGVGFDASGSRIGHGAGFYDRFFAGCAERGHDPLRIGVAHDVQVVELPPPEEWDVPVHAVVTPSEVIAVAPLPME